MLATVISFVALCVSCVALWKAHFARFSPIALAGSLQHRVYPIRNGDQRWFITSFDVLVSITNPGARPGLVTGLRLRLHYPELPFVGNSELIAPKWELKADKVSRIDEHRFAWIDEVVAGDWSPFIILPKATAAKHLLFEARWEKPVIQKRVIATLEMQADRRTKWMTVTEWEFALVPRIWVDLVRGHALSHGPKMDQSSIIPECSPPDLHKYTGTKADLPSEGLSSAAEPSYLDYPEPKKD